MSDLHELLADRIDALSTGPGDLAAVRATGRRIRLRRRVATGAALAATVAAVGVGFVVVGQDGDGAGRARDQYASVGALDFSHGARAYGNGTFLSLGGRRFPAAQLDYLDTDAVATSAGIVFYDRGRPMLLGASGDVAPLVAGAVGHDPDFHPTAKAEGTDPVVAWAVRDGDAVTITVQDLATDEVVASTRPDCGRCSDLVIDAIDGGVVFVRTGAGTRTWDSGTGEWRDFAGPETRVADVRNGVVLYDGPSPTTPGDWTLVPGAVDAQLTFDGGHVLSWSSTLEPTAPGGSPIVLDRGPADGKGYGQWTFDTDGSILLATAGRGRKDVIYDCVLPSGTCEEVDAFESVDGDPMFLGNDM